MSVNKFWHKLTRHMRVKNEYVKTVHMKCESCKQQYIKIKGQAEWDIIYKNWKRYLVLSNGGNAGKVLVSLTGKLTMLNGAQIDSSTFAQGNAGNVTVETQTLEISGVNHFNGVGSKISSDSNGDELSGDAGKVNISIGGEAKILGGGLISSSTHSGGNAGIVNMETDSLLIDGFGRMGFTGIVSSAEPNSSSTRSVGIIEIKVNKDLLIINGCKISRSSDIGILCFLLSSIRDSYSILCWDLPDGFTTSFTFTGPYVVSTS